MEALKNEITGQMMPGDDIITAGYIGLSGTKELLAESRSILSGRFSAGFLDDALRACVKENIPDTAVCPGSVWETALNAGAHCLYALNESGFLGGLWIMAEASETGLKLDLRSVPVLQYTIEFCETAGMDPYRLASGGALLIAVPSGEKLVSSLRNKGIAASICGQADQTNQRLLYSGDIVRYLDKPPKEFRPGRCL